MTVVIVNRQRRKKINAPLLQQLTVTLLAELEVTDAEFGLTLLAAPEMTRVNETFLHHEGSTDVITFDHSEVKTPSSKLKNVLHGELFVCVDEAILQARQFKTTWQTEVVRYVVHGVLHLLGYDDHAAAARRKMKREENRLVRRLAKEFPLARLAR